MSRTVTVREMISRLSELPPDAPLIYGTDDEGNEFRTVIQLPAIMYVKELEHRFLEIVDPDQKGIQVVIIN
jgi:hypothetical protein